MSKHHLIKRSVAAVAVIAAAGFPTAAQARFAEDPPPVVGQPAQVVEAPPVQQRLDQLHTNVQKLFAAEGGWHLATPLVPSTPSSHGFQWGDAGIGAAGAALLLGAGALGARTARRRRRPVVG